MKEYRTRKSAISRVHFLFGILLLIPSLSSGQGKLDLSKLIFEEQILTEAISSNPNNSFESAEILAGTEEPQENANLRAIAINQYQQAIAEADDGPFATGLVEQFEALGLLYQQNQEHSEAIAALEEAQHIIRINQGLFTLEQNSLIQSLMESHRAQGNSEKEDSLREYLFYIQQKNYSEDDPQMISHTRNWADWNVQSFQRIYNNPDSPPLFNGGNDRLSASDYIRINDGFSSRYVPRSGFGDFASTGSSSVNMHALIEPRLSLARDLYTSLLERNEGLSDSDPAYIYSAENLELQRNLANIAFIVKTQMQDMADSSYSTSFDSNRIFQLPNSTSKVVTDGYRNGRIAFQDIIDARKEAPDANPIDLALALLELADWQLVFDHPQAAFKIYEEAFSVLASAGKTEAEISTLISSELPSAIPTFSIHPYSRELQQLDQEADLNYRGYIDLSLTHDRFGNRKKIRILSSSDDTPLQVRRTLLKHLRTQKTRPTIVAGEPEQRTDIQLRYYYAY